MQLCEEHLLDAAGLYLGFCCCCCCPQTIAYLIPERSLSIPDWRPTARRPSTSAPARPVESPDSTPTGCLHPAEDSGPLNRGSCSAQGQGCWPTERQAPWQLR